MKNREPQSKTPTTTVRLPPELHAMVKESAARNGHSMNAEIIHRLSAVVGKPIQIVTTQNEKTHELLKELIAKVEALPREIIR